MEIQRREPASFSTICTNSCRQELIGFLLSLSLHHPGAKTYVICDTETRNYIMNSTPQPRLDIQWEVTLDKYTKYNRDQMTKKGIWSDFQMEKANVISLALENETDTLFLDSDTIILNKLYVNDPSKQLGVSPQFIGKSHVQRTGYYNGGMLWTNQRSLPEKWKEYTKTSRYFDQASIEDLVREYDAFEYDDDYNLQTYRFILGLEPANKIASYVSSRNGNIYYKHRTLKFIHTHFNLAQFKQINDFFIAKLEEAKKYKELAIIYRVINDKWVLQIPKQPMNGIWSHGDDSYRELALMMANKHADIEVKYSRDSPHCWLLPNILTYDRPNLNWLNEQIKIATLILLGNGSMEDEGKKLRDLSFNVKPWIFWPRKPLVLEKVLEENGILSYDDRKTGSIFIGNFENSVQKKYRVTEHRWQRVLDEYHCTKGTKHKFSQTQYLNKLRNARYGLCLRGFGSKCHREVELMAFGTVPLITDEVSIDSYMDPPVEGIHYIRVSNPEDLRDKVANITKEKWEEMSRSCYEWYQRNIHSSNCWNTMISNILYT
jgi:hypothetical protein